MGVIRRRGEAPLHTLASFLRDNVGDVVSDVHLLPMFPWTSDDGFAVVDHRAINPSLGTWSDVADLAEDRALMFDFVANHTSSRSPGSAAGWHGTLRTPVSISSGTPGSTRRAW